MKRAQVLLAIAALTPVLAFAAGPKPGEYDVGGIQRICIVAGGTWYGTTFANWGGGWVFDAGTRTTSIYGNYASGVGNDQMALKRGKVNWTEWRDDLSTQVYLPGLVFTRLSATCSVAKTTGQRADPAR